LAAAERSGKIRVTVGWQAKIEWELAF
jgi:hypothetical protein